MADGSLGTRIKRARERQRWTQQELADRLSVNRKTVDNWENGRTVPRSSLGALYELLGDLSGTDGRLDFDPGDPDEVRIVGWTDLPVPRRQAMIHELREAKRRAPRTA